MIEGEITEEMTGKRLSGNIFSNKIRIIKLPIYFTPVITLFGMVAGLLAQTLVIIPIVFGIMFAVFLIILIVFIPKHEGSYICEQGIHCKGFWNYPKPFCNEFFLPFSEIKKIHFIVGDEMVEPVRDHFNLPKRDTTDTWIKRQIILELTDGTYKVISRKMLDSPEEIETLLKLHVDE